MVTWTAVYTSGLHMYVFFTVQSSILHYTSSTLGLLMITLMLCQLPRLLLKLYAMQRQHSQFGQIAHVALFAR